ARKVALEVLNGTLTGGTSSDDSEMRTIQMGSITSGIHTGGDTNPEIFVAGLSDVKFTGPDGLTTSGELYYDATNDNYQYGTKFPSALVLVNGSRRAATTWDWVQSAPDVQTDQGRTLSVTIGLDLQTDTGWNLSDAYFVNNWPGTPYTLHKG
ncbi:hypothetical protein AIG71_25805, partial [Salmonella enterica subsp. enterica]|nr:hypothetical protein [Salmonella enterica subsp. enterica serovar Abaetetuba]